MTRHTTHTTPAYNETLKKQNMFSFSVPGTSQINGGNNIPCIS